MKSIFIITGYGGSGKTILSNSLKHQGYAEGVEFDFHNADELAYCSHTANKQLEQHDKLVFTSILESSGELLADLIPKDRETYVTLVKLERAGG